MTRIPVYFINLQSRPDRRQFMEEQFARLDIVAERINAVVAAEVDESRLRPHQDLGNPWATSRIEVACCMSHELAWRTMLAAGARHALVLEDDVIMGQGLPALLDADFNEGLGAELIKLETTGAAIRLGRPVRQVGSFAVRQLLSSHMGGGAYIISAAMARRALSDPALKRMSVDRYLFSRGGPILPSRGLYQVDPAPALQLEFYQGDQPAGAMRSDLTPDRDRHRASVPHTFAYRLTDSLARARYSLRAFAHTITDPVARTEPRRVVQFEAGL